MISSKNVWLIGTGLMGLEYAKVLKGLGIPFTAIGRGKISCYKFKDETGKNAIEGGLSAFLQTNPALPSAVIVAVGIEGLSEITCQLLDYEVKYILLEKPGVGFASEIKDLVRKTKEKGAKVLLAYNRRFYASVIKAKEIIKQDGGVSSFNFEFTEWSHLIKDLKKCPAEHNNWFLGNSTHIIDTAFYLGGIPKEICTFVKGKHHLKWHPASSNFAGAGETVSGSLFSYHANWEAPGRWSIEIMTNKHRLIFKPIEKLQIQNLGSVVIDFVEGIDYSDDEKYKPGLFRQTKSFLNQDTHSFSDIYQQEVAMGYYVKMSGYK